MEQLYELSRPFPEKFVHKAPVENLGTTTFSYQTKTT